MQDPGEPAQVGPPTEPYDMLVDKVLSRAHQSADAGSVEYFDALRFIEDQMTSGDSLFGGTVADFDCSCQLQFQLSAGVSPLPDQALLSHALSFHKLCFTANSLKLRRLHSVLIISRMQKGLWQRHAYAQRPDCPSLSPSPSALHAIRPFGAAKTR